MKPNEIKGKKVFTARGIYLGNVDDIEIDNNWAITVDVSLTNEAENLLYVRSGLTHKSIMPIPSTLMGSIIQDKITLTELADPKELIARVRKK